MWREKINPKGLEVAVEKAAYKLGGIESRAACNH